MLLLTLSFSLVVSTQVNQFVKYFSSKPPEDGGCNVIGTYKNLIVCASTMIYFIDDNTGDFVTGITSPIKFTDYIIESNYLILCGADSTIEKWDLDTITKVKQLKPASVEV
ncbi:hypothetical protein MP638_006945 [Amoeboaphelidium occidentale]|nr:hypothetical protein MP638_006945 [Amoeboaphelidium occidentale]